MGRTKRISNASLLAAAATVVGERGADRTRLSDIAAVSGLAPATLLQRFGSLEALLAEVSAVSVSRVADAFSPNSGSEIGGLAKALVEIAATRHLVLLVARPAAGAGYSLELRKQIAYSLIRAVEVGEVVHCDVAELARRIQIGFYGLALAAALEGGNVDLQAINLLLHETLSDLM